jgi:hypothetical protein
MHRVILITHKLEKVAEKIAHLTETLDQDKDIVAFETQDFVP